MSYTPEFDYPWEEFKSHLDHFCALPDGVRRHTLMSYFSQHYPPFERSYKMNRFGKAFAFMMRHLDYFEQFVVIGDQRKALIAAPLFFALWRHFGAIPEQHLNEEPDPADILDLAKEELGDE